VTKILAVVFLCVFVGILCVGTLGQVQISRETIKISFDFGQNFCDKKISLSFSHLSTFDIVSNLVMLIPIGMFVVFFYHKGIVKTSILLLCVGILSGFLIELCQFIFPVPRSVQLSDVVFNTISVIVGGIIGWLYLFLGTKINKKIYKK
jgi:hypothetical protein